MAEEAEFLKEPKALVSAEAHVAVAEALEDGIAIGDGRVKVVAEPHTVIEVYNNCDP